MCNYLIPCTTFDQNYLLKYTKKFVKQIDHMIRLKIKLFDYEKCTFTRNECLGVGI